MKLLLEEMLNKTRAQTRSIASWLKQIDPNVFYYGISSVDFNCEASRLWEYIALVRALIDNNLLKLRLTVPSKFYPDRKWLVQSLTEFFVAAIYAVIHVCSTVLIMFQLLPVKGRPAY